MASKDGLVAGNNDFHKSVVDTDNGDDIADIERRFLTWEAIRPFFPRATRGSIEPVAMKMGVSGATPCAQAMYTNLRTTAFISVKGRM